MTDSVVKERDFYRAKLEQSQGRIRNLEHDLAELQTRDKILSERVKHLASNPPRRPRSRYARH
jgi:chromosome segregation ATPase